MPGWLKHLCFILFLVVFAGCAGSCSSCSGCGMTPLPGGFPSEDRIENIGAVRLTDSGLKFIGDNIGNLAPSLLGDSAQGNAGVVTFEIPKSTNNIALGLSATICPNNPNPNATPYPECIVEADLGKANLTVGTKAPHNITVTGTLAVRIRKLPVQVTLLGTQDVVLTNNASCSNRDWANIPVNVDVSLEADDDPNHASRIGYTRVRILAVTINQNALEDSIGFCGNFGATVLNFLKGFVLGSVTGGLTDTLVETIEEQLCTSEDPTAGVTCPTGTYPDTSGVCRYCNPNGNGQCPSSAECVSMALGADGNINLSSALSGISPGAKGGFDFLAALGGAGLRDDNSGHSWGDLNPINSGATIGMMGGAEPKPISQCVPLANVEKPTGLLIPDELLANTVPGWTGDGPHIGFGLAERYLNYTLAATYNSGALCIGVGSSVFGSLLNSDTIGLLVPSFKDLARQRTAAPLALILRPQEPPSAKVGNGTDIATDPTLEITLNKLGIDFYVWSNDRYIRGFTATFDVVAPVNLDVTSEGLAPVIDAVQINNPVLSNAPLLREDEAAAAKSLAGILSSQIGSALGGAISPIDLNSALGGLGLTLDIPPSVQGQGSPGIRKLEKGADRYLGIFAAFGTAAPQPKVIAPVEVETLAEVADKRVSLEGLVLTTITDKNRPVIDLRLSSPQDSGAKPVEYQYRVNGGLWHPWTFDRNVSVRTPDLSLQAKHRIEVRGRVAGQPETMDRSPAQLEVRIDKTAPFLDVSKRARGGKLDLHVRDTVSDAHAVRVRVALDDQPFGEWRPATELASLSVGDAKTVKVEAVDEEGNVGTVTQAIIRGKEDATLAGDSGCDCGVVGTGGRSTLRFGFPALLALGLALWLRRRRTDKPAAPSRRGRSPARRARVLGSFAMMAVASSWSGCSCGSDDEAKKPGKPAGACPNGDECEVLEPGLVGAYASAAAAGDGTLWVAAYNDHGYGIAPSYEETYSFGDLVVGKYDGTRVTWESVDGLPAVDSSLEPGSPGGPPDPLLYDTDGFRRGLVEPGDDVGLWTSIAIVGAQPAVAYYDATNRALRYARYDGSKWTTHEVQKLANSDVGRYAKLAVVGDKPVVAFLAVGPGDGGYAKSVVRVATASSTSPSAGSDWSFEDAAVHATTPCRAWACSSGTACVQSNGQCVATGSCDPKCSAGQACVDLGSGASCQDVFDANYTDTYPEASGLYISLAATASGLAIAYYDRVQGNVMAVRREGGTWQPPVLVDGQGTGPSGPVDTGDVGIGLSLFVDSSGDWHLAYVNGFDESLTYAKVVGGTTPGQPEVVDDGTTADGQALVGDDSSIFVTAGGEVRIAYQDATNGKLRWAVGTPSGDTHSWTTKDLVTPGFSGGFNQILDGTRVISFWRQGKPKTIGDVAVITP